MKYLFLISGVVYLLLYLFLTWDGKLTYPSFTLMLLFFGVFYCMHKLEKL